MSVLVATIAVSFNGVEASFSPLCLTFEEGAVQQYELFGITKAADAPGVYTIIPTVDAFTTITALLGVNHYDDVALRFQHQSDAGVPIGSGGLCLLLGSRIDSGRLTNVLAHAGARTFLNGLVVGSALLCPTSEADSLTVTFAAPDTSDTIILYVWDFGDGETEETTDPSIVHTYATAGTYSVSVRMNISGGGSVAVGGCPITVTGEVTLGCPVTEITDLSVDFTAIQPTGGVTVTNWHWNFGDGNSEDTGTTVTVHHDYAIADTYDVVLTATTTTVIINSGVCPVTVTPPPPCLDTLREVVHEDWETEFCPESVFAIPKVREDWETEFCPGSVFETPKVDELWET